MSRLLIRFHLAALILVLVTPRSTFAWRFVSVGDSRGSNNGVNDAVLTSLITRINAENCDLLVF